ncbi:hypothetical protein VNO77_27274 [Canavalia gladiata]|uniref:Uncharacterized protein n=1 Tax=Canavalia gladiata TaxID=3824 RepID=A0AAN9KYJ5_CANGL
MWRCRFTNFRRTWNHLELVIVFSKQRRTGLNSDESYQSPIKILGRRNLKLLDRRVLCLELVTLKETSLRTPLEAAHQGSGSIEFSVTETKFKSIHFMKSKEKAADARNGEHACHFRKYTYGRQVEVITVVISALLSLAGLLAPTVVTKPSELLGGGGLESKALLMLLSNMHVDKSKRNSVKGGAWEGCPDASRLIWLERGLRRLGVTHLVACGAHVRGT